MSALMPAEIAALKREIFASLHVALPGTVEAFDAETGTADIRPAVKTRDGTALPLLRQVPVCLPEEREIRAGDFALVLFADCDTEALWESGTEEVPRSGRMHSLSDGFAFVGFRAGGRGEGGEGP